jgi:hypothetical protein
MFTEPRVAAIAKAEAEITTVRTATIIPKRRVNLLRNRVSRACITSLKVMPMSPPCIDRTQCEGLNDCPNN